MKILFSILLISLIFFSFGCTNEKISDINNNTTIPQLSDSYTIYENGAFSFKYNNSLILDSEKNPDDAYQLMLLNIPNSVDEIKISLGHYPNEITIEEICNGLNNNPNFKPKIIKEKEYSKCTLEDIFEHEIADMYIYRTIILSGSNQVNFEYHSFFESGISIEEARELSLQNIETYFNPIVNSIIIDYSSKTFDQNGIKFDYSKDLEVHLGGIMNNPSTILNLIPYHERSSISIQKSDASQDSFTNDLCDDLLNYETTNNVRLAKIGELDACKIDYNTSYNDLNMHCLQYITIKNKIAYSINYCMNLRPCDPDLEVEIIEGFIENDCEMARIGDKALFETDINNYLQDILNSFEITE
jgi:hypothetical protein